jgi:hypothetical protein
MLSIPAAIRCPDMVILQGILYTASVGFQRHAGCHYRHHIISTHVRNWQRLQLRRTIVCHCILLFHAALLLRGSRSRSRWVQR